MSLPKYMTVSQRDGSVWGVPVEMIARDRAKHYASEFDGDIDRSLAEDTIPLFESDTYNIQDWAVGNMNWSDFAGHQVCLRPANDLKPHEFQDAWMGGGDGYTSIHEFE